MCITLAVNSDFLRVSEFKFHKFGNIDGNARRERNSANICRDPDNAHHRDLQLFSRFYFL